MPKRARELGPLDVKRAAHPGGHPRNHLVPVGGVAGLMLQITPTGAKSWILRAMVGGRRRAIGLGPWPEVALADARDRARAARARIGEGFDPVEERKAARAALVAAARRGLTFADAVDRYLKAKAGEFRNEKHKRQWQATLAAYALPDLGGMLVQDIEVPDVLRILAPIWTDKTETATRLRGRVEAVLSWATVAGHRTGDNPARWRGALSELLPAPGKLAAVVHHPALSLTDAASWFAELRERDGMAARALEFATLTAARSGEVRGMTWAELDLSAALWTVPAARMKARREHRAPLTPDAVALLEALPRFDGCELVFPGARGRPLSDMSLSAVCRRMQDDAEAEAKERGQPVERAGWRDPRSARPVVPHGLRSTFRDWCAERGIERDLAEIALAHVVGSDVERAYRRSDMLDRRRAVMADWAAFLSGREAARVVPFPTAARG